MVTWEMLKMILSDVTSEEVLAISITVMIMTKTPVVTSDMEIIHLQLA